MALEGFLQEFGLADILQLLYFQKKTGILSIEGKLDTIELSFINGNISGLKSQRRLEGNKLGRILIKRGLISQDDLTAAIEAQKAEGLKVGNYFVKQGLVTKEQVLEVVQEQIIETIVHIFSWKEGRYEFIPQGIATDKELPIFLDTQHLLMDGLRIVDEWSVVENKLDLSSVYKKVADPEPGSLSDTEQEVLDLVDSERDGMSIIESSNIGDFETAKVIVALQEKGVIAPVKPVQEATVTEKKAGPSFFVSLYTLIFVIAVSLCFGSYSTFKVFKGVKTVFAIERLKSEIDVYKAVNGAFPQNIGVVGGDENDMWGNPYVYAAGQDSFTLYSTGPDGAEATEDDVY